MLPKTDIQALALRFHALFAPGETGHGVYTLIEDGVKEGSTENKRDNAHKEFVREPVTTELWIQHLTGKRGLGIVPIRRDGTVTWGAIDIDAYGIDYVALAQKILTLNLPLVPCRSKSGGIHAYIFASEPVSAYNMQTRLRDIAGRLEHGGAEVFPKQTGLEEDNNGSWLNMPYFNGDNGTRYAVRPDGERLTMEQFLARAEQVKANAAWFAAKASGSVFPAPRAKTAKGFSVPDIIADGQRDTTLTRAAGKMRRAGLSTEEILPALLEVNQKRCRPPLADSDVERIARSIGKKEAAPIDEDDGLTKGLGDAIKAGDSFARDKGGLLYHWEGGVYRPTGERLIERRVKQLCEAWDKTKVWSPELATRVCAWIKVDTSELWECPPLDVLNCKNGLLNVATRTLSPHSPDHLSAVQIAASFDPAATCPQIEQFIRDVFPADTRHLPFEVTGWLMLADTSIQKAVLLLGEGANGKSVWLNLLLTFLGRENVSTISLHRLESDKFSVARLVGKLCNIGTDLPTAALAGTSMFKILTGGDTVTAERKYEASFEFRPFARLLFSANSAPRSEDSTHGFFRRWLVIPFNRTFSETDPDTVPRAVLDARLSEPGELSGLLNRALDALPGIRMGRFTESESTLAALADFRATTDPLAVWLEQATVERADSFVVKDALRRAYGQICQENGRPILGDTQFTAALRRLRPRVEAARKRVDGRQIQVFVGLGFVTRDPEPQGLF